MEFKSISDLEKWVKTNQGQNAILNEKEIRRVLTEAGQELQRLMIAELNAYYQSYEPTVYKRTGNTVDSIRVGKPQKISINEWALAITFDEALANHPSYISSDQPDGYTPWLLEVGWNITDKIGRYVPMFTEHKGTHYITKAVNKFNNSNKHGLKVTVEHNGQRYI